MDTVTHFNQPELDDDIENEMTEEEAKSVVRACIQGVLAYNKIEAPIDFKNFRIDLEGITLTEDSPHIIKLIQSPYFFHRTTLRILLSLIKSKTGAQLENSLANANLIVPKIWEGLQHPEKYQVGRTYSELFSDGQTKASSGLKQLLLKVKGFDFVPEDLRSTSFINIANELIKTHDGIDNYYNEPAVINTLNKMGSVIPIPAFPICMTAILSVKLGNRRGSSHSAQNSANSLLKTISTDRWIYFFKECLPSNDRILYKVTLDNPSSRWLSVFSRDFIEKIITEIKDKNVMALLRATKDQKQDRIKKAAEELYSKLGYESR